MNPLYFPLHQYIGQSLDNASVNDLECLGQIISVEEERIEERFERLGLMMNEDDDEEHVNKFCNF